MINLHLQLHIADLKEKLNSNKEIIEIKKKFTYEKDFCSKVLLIYSIEQKAQETNKKSSAVLSS